MKNITQLLKIVSLALVLSFGISYVYAWTAPTSQPPTGNVSAPINTSTTGQVKDGSFGVNGLLRGYGSTVVDGNLGIGETNPAWKLHVSASSNTNVAKFSGLSSRLYFQSEPNYFSLYGYNQADASGKDMNFSAMGGGTTQLYLKSTGNVGVGTTAPTKKLDVVGAVQASGDVCTSLSGGKCLSTVSGGVTDIHGDVIWVDAGQAAVCPDGYYLSAMDRFNCSNIPGHPGTTAACWGKCNKVR